jgi:hypothetical protein
MGPRLVRLERAGRLDTIDLDQYASGDIIERSHVSANAWIKGLRHAQVDGQGFRDRFTYRGDSLWWFAELFLHREAVVDTLWRTALALDALIAREQPAALGVAAGDHVLAALLPQAARRHDVRVLETPERADGRAATQAWRSRTLAWSARASRWLPHGSLPQRAPGGAAVFVHSAFWRSIPGASSDAGSDEVRLDWQGEEGYIGPVLTELARSASDPIHLVGVGPTTNFRARRWWHPMAPWRHGTPSGGAIVPVGWFATREALGWREVWRTRHAMAAVLQASEDLRARTRVDGYDVWPIIADELAGIATLQFPWSARAMDEAGAALDALKPDIVVTYAEAGGWGRAIMLESRRRAIASVGLQHGFIYRHWLNYRHEADEMRPSIVNAGDDGFPRPSLTLVHDGYAAEHLRCAGRFPDRTVRVTGSSGLDRLAAALAEVSAADRDEIRRKLGVAADARVAVVISKRAQLAHWLPALVEAAARTEPLRLIVKPHPAETADVYAADLEGSRTASLAPASADLPSLLAIADVLVTVNSTVALDAMVLGIPALAVGLPNNLSPFVDRGAMVGAAHVDDLARLLQRVTRDEDHRQRLIGQARAFAAGYGIEPDGRSAERAAAAIWALRARGTL